MTPAAPLGPRHPLVVGPALVAPLLVLVAGLLRLVDVMDGGYGDGPAWDLGHAALLFAFLLLAVLVVGLARSVPPITGSGRGVTEAAVAVGLLGAVGSMWVAVAALAPESAAAAHLPGSVSGAAATLLVAGLATLLLLLVEHGALAWWSPAAVVTGALAVAWQVDLMPFAASLVLLGLAPLTSLRLPLPSGSPVVQR
ncbi:MULTISPECIES: hypothetical protein [Mumia]|uniref:hypothetical protein n=1 Tax=Mumia TaxID=1546255 RepID=UPI001420BC21|nr:MULTISPECIES: hypothetical protein [unclassified Mumia]QMW66157.1 hypothetical protein H4N58_18780 [Mumia sp. ZJ1417]